MNEILLINENTDINIILSRPFISYKSSVLEKFLSTIRNFDYGFDWWADWYQDRLNGKPIDIDLWEKTTLLPESLLDQGPEAVNAYLKSLTEGEAKSPLNRVRVIFIGDGAAGKTSLIHTLYNEPVVAGMEPMTPGVEIREWDVPNTAIKAHFWDFGGQVIAHAMHKFFLRESCLYVLVQEARPGGNANERAEYWLEHVQRFGHGAPVLLVGNKADQTPISLDLRTLRDRYKNIVDFFPLSCTEYQCAFRSHFEIFRNALANQLKQVGTHQILFTLRHFKVLENLQQQSPTKSFLEKSAYQIICEKYGVEVEGGLNRDWLLDWLDKLGLIVHFPNIPTLDEYILNPRWLTHGVYTLLYSEVANQGQLHDTDAVKVLKSTTAKDELGNILEYSSSKCDFILKAMEQFEIAYRLPENNQVFILPDLLPATRPEYLSFDKTGALSFDFDFIGLLPRHIMTVFIVRRHREIVDKLVWQNGVRLASKAFQAQALAQVDYHRRRLSLWVSDSDASRYFSELYAAFKSLLEPLGKPEPSEWVGLPVAAGYSMDDRPRANFRQLLALERAGENRYIDESGTYLLNEVLKIMPKEEREKQGREIHFHGVGPVIYQEGGIMTDVTQGDKTVMLSKAKLLHKKLGEIAYDVEIQVEDEALRSQALRELQKIRKALETLEKGTVEQRKGALEALSHFGDKAKEGAGKTVEALKSIKEGGEAVGWIMQTVPLIVETLANLAA
jgi:GTPase SAR1 family protein